MITFIKPSNEGFFAAIVSNFYMAEAFTDIVHFTFVCVPLALLNDIAMRWEKPVTHSFDNTW